MTNSSSSLLNSRLLLPELIWLEPEHVEQAKAMNAGSLLEAQQWQSYLNTLALLGFEQWLSNRLPEQAIQRLSRPTDSVAYIEVNGFTMGLIAVEHVLDETVRIPQAAVEQPELVAHFYVLLEVSEEQELVTVRGFLRFDELINYRDRSHLQVQDGCYLLPLTSLDAEPNHLLFYCRSLQPSAIALPTRLPAPTEDLAITLTQAITTLAQWFQDVFDESWQAIDQLINPEADLVFSIRNTQSGARRGKLINLGAQLSQLTVALVVTVTLEAEGKLGVLVQLHPTGEARYLVANLKLSLRSQTGKTLQEVTARIQDNYIQLKPFKGRSGTRFSVAIQLDGEIIEENFVL